MAISITYKKILTAFGAILTLATTFTSIVFAYIDKRTDALDKRIDEKYSSAVQYVDVKHQFVESKLENIEKLLLRIDDRVYTIKKNLKE